jgi:hypothetical protein
MAAVPKVLPQKLKKKTPHHETYLISNNVRIIPTPKYYAMMFEGRKGKDIPVNRP